MAGGVIQGQTRKQESQVFDMEGIGYPGEGSAKKTTGLRA